MRRLRQGLIGIVAGLTIMCLLVGCNTLEGAGKDIEAGGEAIQDAAN